MCIIMYIYISQVPQGLQFLINNGIFVDILPVFSVKGGGWLVVLGLTAL